MNAATTYARRHATQIEHQVSLVGAMGLGYLILHSLKCALPLAAIAVLLMACAKISLVLAVQCRPVLPPGKPLAYRLAWYFLVGLIIAFVLGTAVLFGASIIWSITA